MMRNPFFILVAVGSLMIGMNIHAQNTYDPELVNMMRRAYGEDVAQIGNIDKKTREMVSCVALTTLGATPQLVSHANKALDEGVTPVELREAIYLVAPFAGFPKVLNAMEVVNGIFRERGVSLPLPDQGTTTDGNRHDKGWEIQNELYSGGISHAMEGLPGEMGEQMARLLTDVCFGDIYTRNGLSLQMHELLTYVVLTVLQAPSQLHSHFLGCLKAGNSPETVVAAVINCMPHIGFPATINTLRIIIEMLNEIEKNDQNDLATKHGVKLTFPVTNRTAASSNTGESYVSLLKHSGNNMVAHFLFAKGARNYWHLHPDAEQSLMILDGEAYYQEEGQPKQLLKAGDVVVTKPNIKHWNGATENSACVCITITEMNDKEHAMFDRAVTDEEFLGK